MRRLARVLFWTAVVLGVVVGGLRAFAIRWWRVPEGDPYLAASIAPTLRAGDLVLLWRATPPAFADLVVCPEPGRPDRVTVGRIVGESGDTISVVDADVTVNDKHPISERACNPIEFVVPDPNSGEDVRQSCQVENLGGHLHMRGATGEHRLPPLSVKREVAAGKVFLVSDNRLYPYDSREFGTVDRSSCRETVVFRLWSRAGFFEVGSRFSFIQ
jgi:signal peptidase I